MRKKAYATKNRGESGILEIEEFSAIKALRRQDVAL